MSDLGLFKYSSNKDLYLFRYEGQDLPEVTECVCTAYHTTESGQSYPEFDKFVWVDLDEIDSRTGPSLGTVLNIVLKQEILNYYWPYGEPSHEDSCIACRI